MNITSLPPVVRDKLRNSLDKKYSSEDIFTSREFTSTLQRWLDTLANTLLAKRAGQNAVQYRRFTVKVEDEITTDYITLGAPDAMLVRNQIYIFLKHPAIANIKSDALSEKYITVCALFAHELAHVLYTSFAVMKKKHFTLLTGTWYPRKPIVSGLEGEPIELDLLAMKNSRYQLELFMDLEKDIFNILEDAYVINRFSRELPGELSHYLRLLQNKREDVFSCSVEKVLGSNDSPFSYIPRLLYMYAVFGKFIVEDKATLQLKAAKIIIHVMPLVDKFMDEDDPQERTFISLCIMSVFWHEALSEATEQELQELLDLLNSLLPSTPSEGGYSVIDLSPVRPQDRPNSSQKLTPADRNRQTTHKLLEQLLREGKAAVPDDKSQLSERESKDVQDSGQRSCSEGSEGDSSSADSLPSDKSGSAAASGTPDKGDNAAEAREEASVAAFEPGVKEGAKVVENAAEGETAPSAGNGEGEAAASAGNGEGETAASADNGEGEAAASADNGEGETAASADNGEGETATSADNGVGETAASAGNGEGETAASADNGEGENVTSADNGEGETTTSADNGEGETATSAGNDEDNGREIDKGDSSTDASDFLSEKADSSTEDDDGNMGESNADDDDDDKNGSTSGDEKDCDGAFSSDDAPSSSFLPEQSAGDGDGDGEVQPYTLPCSEERILPTAYVHEDDYDYTPKYDVNSRINSIIESLRVDQAINACEEDLQQELVDELEQFKKSLTGTAAIHSGVEYIIKRGPYIQNPDAEAAYDRMMAEMKPLSKRMQRQVEQKLKDSRQGGKRTGLYSGKAIYMPALVQDKDRYFYKNKLPAEMAEICVGVLVDLSGSMNGARIGAAMKAASLLYDFCKALQLPIAVYGHRTVAASAVSQYVEGVELVSFADFKAADGYDKYRLMSMEAGGANRDGAAIAYMLDLLKKRPEDHKVLFVISDGRPNGNNYSGNIAKTDIQEQTWAASRKGITTVAAAIGNDLDTLRSIYPTCLDMRDLNLLPKRLTEILVSAIKKNI